MEDTSLIFDKIRKIFSTHFEIDESLIKPETLLFEELDLDSIDAIDMVILLEKETGKKLAIENMLHIRSIQDVVEEVEKMMVASE